MPEVKSTLILQALCFYVADPSGLSSYSEIRVTVILKEP
jgi:hypothetical protein